MKKESRFKIVEVSIQLFQMILEGEAIPLPLPPDSEITAVISEGWKVKLRVYNPSFDVIEQGAMIPTDNSILVGKNVEPETMSLLHAKTDAVVANMTKARMQRFADAMNADTPTIISESESGNSGS